MARPALQVRTPQPAHALLAAEQIKDIRTNRETRGQMNELAIQQQLQALDDAGRARMMEEARLFGNAFRGVTDQAGYESAVQSIAPFADIGRLPTTYDQDTVARMIRTAEILSPPGEAFTLGQDQVRFGPGGEVIARGPVSPPSAPAGFTLSSGQTRFDASGNPIAAGPEAPPDTEAVADRANELRDEVNALSKNFVEVRDAYSRVQAAQESAAGDISLIFNFMKMLDPGSVIRESEFEQAAAAGSYGARIQGMMQRALTGQRLAPEVRQDFMNQAQFLLSAQQSNYETLLNTYGGIADRLGVPRENVLIDQRVPEPVTPTAAPATAQPGNISSMSLEDLRALDPNALTPAERAAAAARWDELMGASGGR